ncbi:MAG: hypothetical protein ACI85F_001915 [Bacteroidia bacterium]|jgi:uncharacterized protein YbjT (DUF2867 family)
MNAALAGGTGLIGSFLTQFLDEDSDFESIQFLSRKRVDLSDKFQVVDLSEMSKLTAINVGFCALGTTMATAGSKEAFYKIDHDLVLDFAKSCKQVGAKTFVLVSSVGANSKTSNFYLKVKGEVEEAVNQLGFDRLVILRPSMLLGPRKEHRLGELIGKKVMCAIDPLMFGPMDKYRGINAATVARAMINSIKGSGIETLENSAIRKAAGESY